MNINNLFTKIFIKTYEKEKYFILALENNNINSEYEAQLANDCDLNLLHKLSTTYSETTEPRHDSSSSRKISTLILR